MDHISFSNEELARYSRHILIPEFQLAAQKCLKAASVLVIGSGGLGSPMLQYLAAAGVGKIGIVDFDRVEDSNLQRQVLFGTSSIGELKAEEARKRLLDLNPFIEVAAINEMLTSENAMRLLADYDVVADGSDNFPTRYLVNDACVLLDKPYVYASIFQFEGQVSVFNYRNQAGETGPNYRDLFPTPPPPGMVPSCAEGGVLGVLPGIIGSVQALEVIKVITGVGEPLSGRLFLFDALQFFSRVLSIPKDPDNPINGISPTQTGLIDYEQFCGVPTDKDLEEQAADVKEIDVLELVKWQKEGKFFQLIDVREPYEYEIVNIGGELIPQALKAEMVEKIARDIPVVFHCRSGKRSANVVRALESEQGFKHLYNLKGGILAYIEEIDSSLPKY
ncbi:MAG: molybdopterin-synthase adenylyltransferase MoeB [Bacteroidota bacterium]